MAGREEERGQGGRRRGGGAGRKEEMGRGGRRRGDGVVIGAMPLALPPPSASVSNIPSPSPSS